MKNNCARRFFLISIILFLALPLSAQYRRSYGLENEGNRIVYALTGVKLSKTVRYYENMPDGLARLYHRTCWSENGSPRYLMDKVIPDFAGAFDVAENLVPSLDDGSWVKDFFSNDTDAFKVSRPLEYQLSLKNIEENQNSDVGKSLSSGENRLTDPEEKLLSGQLAKSGDQTVADNRENKVSEDKENLEESSKSNQLPELPSLQPAGEEGLQNQEEEIPLVSAGLVEDSPEIRLKNSQNMLRLHSFEKEFISFEENAGQKVIVISDGKKMFRKYFDSNQRLVKKEEWKPGSSISSINILNTEYFTYPNEEVLIPSSKKIVSSNMEEIFTFDEKSRVTKILYFSYPENYKKEKDEEKPYLLLWESSFSYTESGKLKEKEYIAFEYSDEKYGKISSKEEKKEEWLYKAEESLADYYYYEDQILCLKTIYSSSSDWVTTMYFGNGFTVENYWKKGRQEKDLYYYNGILTRRKNYDEE
ncbi:MAG: hypothetical protein K6E78_05615 [Treponema sp.]|nr:hypothetical protein [Treponema sp.]